MIPASNPVVVETQTITYNAWFVKSLLSRFVPNGNAINAPTVVVLNRSYQAEDGSWVLMPDGPGSSVTFTVDLFSSDNYAMFENAIQETTNAIVAYASSKNLL